MKSDNEPAIKRLKERVSECLPGVECVPKEAPVGDSRANGSAENDVKQVKGQFRTLCGAPWQVWGADGFDGAWSGKRPQLQEITRK